MVNRNRFVELCVSAPFLVRKFVVRQCDTQAQRRFQQFSVNPRSECAGARPAKKRGSDAEMEQKIQEKFRLLFVFPETFRGLLTHTTVSTSPERNLNQ
jgi:hypothetical protein